VEIAVAKAATPASLAPAAAATPKKCLRAASRGSFGFFLEDMLVSFLKFLKKE
jgi:hypothetical protein